MGKGIRTTTGQGCTSRPLSILLILVTGVVAACAPGAFAQSIQTAAAQAQVQPQQLLTEAQKNEPNRSELDARNQQLIRQREELDRTVKQLQAQQQQLRADQVQERRRIQSRLDESQARLRELEEQLAEVRRERVKADYLAALRARAEQERRQAGAEQATQADQQVEDLARRLKELEQQAQRTQWEMEQLQDKNGPRARELEKALEEVRQQMQSTQGQLTAIERERAAEKEGEEQHERAMLDSAVRGLVRRQEELTQSVEALRKEVQELRNERQKEAGRWQEVQRGLLAVQGQMRRLQQQTRTTQEELGKHQTERQGIETLREELIRQQDQLRSELHGLTEYLRAVVQRDGVETEALRGDLGRLSTDLQQLRAAFEQSESDGLEAQADLKGELRELRRRISESREDLLQMQGAMSLLLSQMDRSTVGSAGLAWGW